MEPKEQSTEIRLSQFMKDVDYDSLFETDNELENFHKKYTDLNEKSSKQSLSALPSKEVCHQQLNKETSIRQNFFSRSMNAYDRHKRLINDYFLYFPGATGLLKRDTSRDKRDIDIIHENHHFLWEKDDAIDTWEKQLAKKYYDKLFKEYCICDLQFYKKNRIALRFRTQQEVVVGKGQFICGEKYCQKKNDLRTWEVNFGYTENQIHKNALVKLRLCSVCSYKLNYKHKRKEFFPPTKKLKKQNENIENVTELLESHKTTDSVPASSLKNDVIWKQGSLESEERSRDDEYEEYLVDLLL